MGSSSSEDSSASSVDERSSLGSRKASAKPKKVDKQSMKKANKTTIEKKGQGPIRSGREECMHVTCWIPRWYRHVHGSRGGCQDLNRIRGRRHQERAKISSQCCMQEIIVQICSEDASHLKPFIGNYTVAQPGVKGLEPPIFLENKKSCARMGVNHPQLVLQHIYTSPSSALIDDGELSVTRSDNAKLHGMYKVEAKHIAYALIQSRFGISSHDKWQETDGNYSYRNAYYRTIKAIQELFDEAWAEELLEWWNKAMFGNKRGVPLFDISDEDEDDDDLVLMRKQSAKCAAAALKAATSVSTPVEVEPPFDPDISTVVPSTPATSLPPEEETTDPQEKSTNPQEKYIPKPRPVNPAEKVACKTSSSMPALASVPPPEADAVAPVSNKVKKRKSEELEADGDSSLSEVAGYTVNIKHNTHL
ncbi:hypothetical protein DFJ58DRAFT_872051 [Suillus subalutaceus]|uniref:uncharacterized protein n=1 Tax=Suillus subalutaceus TaxID=48586 RepID=UPI001B87CF8B|nr:uncharacterized protein DFJ58DRAFT_872051 [Suillus subalutaceus]KAG1831447.1 hypothetical protein DFJ58DRAFT_872051 [Suillus subalutaceus]